VNWPTNKSLIGKWCSKLTNWLFKTSWKDTVWEHCRLDRGRVLVLLFPWQELSQVYFEQMKLDENRCRHTEEGIQAGEADAETKERLLNNITSTEENLCYHFETRSSFLMQIWTVNTIIQWTANKLQCKNQPNHLPCRIKNLMDLYSSDYLSLWWLLIFTTMQDISWDLCKPTIVASLTNWIHIPSRGLSFLGTSTKEVQTVRKQIFVRRLESHDCIKRQQRHIQ